VREGSDGEKSKEKMKNLFWVGLLPSGESETDWFHLGTISVKGGFIPHIRGGGKKKEESRDSRGVS